MLDWPAVGLGVCVCVCVGGGGGGPRTFFFEKGYLLAPNHTATKANNTVVVLRQAFSPSVRK